MNVAENNFVNLGDLRRYTKPFVHYRATNVLNEDSYSKISSAFLSILSNKSGDNDCKLKRFNKNYDTLMLGINSKLAAMFSPFFTEGFLSSVSEFLSKPFVKRIEGGLHSNPRNSLTGYIHTDFCSGWFDESSISDEGIIFPERSRCDYFTGAIKSPTAKPVEYIRSATLIYYLCNDGWQAGDGGETALYGASRFNSNTFFDLVPPVNNSLLLFNCSPHSYHRFISNPGKTRNSLILWLHSTVDYAVSRWGNSMNRMKAK